MAEPNNNPPADPNADAPLMFKIWIQNMTTKEATQILGQGKSLPEAFKDGWENCNEDFGKSSSGAPPTSKARIYVRLPDGRSVWRSPAKFASRDPYKEEEAKQFAAPVCAGEAALPGVPIAGQRRGR